MNRPALLTLILTFATLTSAPDCHAILFLQDDPTGGVLPPLVPIMLNSWVVPAGDGSFAPL
jgi:hypothetical protein